MIDTIIKIVKNIIDCITVFIIKIEGIFYC